METCNDLRHLSVLSIDCYALLNGSSTNSRKIRFGGEEMWLPERFFCDVVLTFNLEAACVGRLLPV